MDQVRVGFIGFGEVGEVLARAMLEHGAEVSAFDIRLDDEAARRDLEVRHPEVRFAPLPSVVRDAAYVVAAVPTQAASAVAAQAAPYLRAGQFYLDLATTAPRLKQELARLIAPTGAVFVEGAILDAIGIAGAAAQILTGGAQGSEAAAMLCRLGLNARFYSPEIGQASLFKMLRSILSKGLEALILEMMLAADRAGIAADLWDDVTAFMRRRPFEEIAVNWVRTHPGACERRYWELVQVRQTLRDLGLDPLMTQATESFFERSRWLGFAQAFPEPPTSGEQVVQFMSQRLAGPEDHCK
jgi:3-hydroxyisobutyrate dehydrogenase-like beta-hydroxyacid dehydrogenase